jgi:4-hydroxy-2-oxovalerate aldolase
MLEHANQVRQPMELLETTLRDGSYGINFQFTASDTSAICSSLEAAGFTWIEIGHGVGLGASRHGRGAAAETDEAYMKAAAITLTRAKFGMFCIPGIATLDDVDLAASYGMGFIRVGTEVGRVEESRPFIERARRHGMMVMANFMKSYTCTPLQFAERARLSAGYGSQVVYVVDSSGGMLPAELEPYFAAVQSVSDVPIGFHGHNNLGLAMANTIRAVELGASIVDSSLQGFGRSSGNAATEMVVAVFKRMGYELGIDLLGTMDAAEKFIRPLIRRQGLSTIDTIAGYSQFHSSYFGTIQKYSEAYRVDPRRLIIALCQIDKVNADPALVETLAKALAVDQSGACVATFQADEYCGNEQTAVSLIEAR